MSPLEDPELLGPEEDCGPREKPRMGRPRIYTGGSVRAHFRMGVKNLELLDEVCRRCGWSRSRVVNLLVERGLRRQTKRR